jgi:3-oxoacyl-(acyl-carrier-protein) synthase
MAGVSDEVSPILHAVLARYGALDPDGRPRPFGRNRCGTLATEGATVLVLEDEEEARQRGSRPVALLRAWGRANDPTATATDWGSGWEVLASAVRSGFERQGLHPEDVGRLVCGASGAERGDELEAHLLEVLFRGKWPPALAPKQLTGEYGGGFLASILWAHGLEVAPTGPWHGGHDPNLPVTLHGGGPLPPAQLTLVTSLASAGAAAWLVLEKP